MPCREPSSLLVSFAREVLQARGQLGLWRRLTLSSAYGWHLADAERAVELSIERYRPVMAALDPEPGLAWAVEVEERCRQSA